MVDQI